MSRLWTFYWDNKKYSDSFFLLIKKKPHQEYFLHNDQECLLFSLHQFQYHYRKRYSTEFSMSPHDVISLGVLVTDICTILFFCTFHV